MRLPPWLTHDLLDPLARRYQGVLTLGQPATAATKSLLASKTFWWNVASIVYYALGQVHTLPQMDTGTQAVVNMIVNIGLRLVTKQGVHVA